MEKEKTKSLFILTYDETIEKKRTLKELHNIISYIHLVSNNHRYNKLFSFPPKEGEKRFFFKKTMKYKN